MTRTVAVVLAGGTSRRFGSDKLDAALPSGTLLETVLAGLPSDLQIVVVGPDRSVSRPVRFAREEPPGGGPAAGLVAGVAAALGDAADAILIVPGDAPRAGRGAGALRAVLQQSHAESVVATDARGRIQPLQLALTSAAAARLVELAGPERGHNASARELVRRLDSVPYALEPDACFDVDTPEQLEDFLAGRTDPP